MKGCNGAVGTAKVEVGVATGPAAYGIWVGLCPAEAPH